MMWKYCLIMKELPLFVKADHLTAGPEARINRQYPLLPHRRCKKKLTKIIAEYSDRFDIAFDDIYSGCRALMESLLGY